MSPQVARAQGAPGVTFDTLYAFSPVNNLTQACYGIIQGNDGSFYGTASQGGASGYGSVFKITPSGTLTTLYSFTGTADSAYPIAQLVLGQDGSFYGTTWGGGGSSGYGSVFKITQTGTLTTLHTFTDGADGGIVYSGLTLGTDGSFYGTTFEGGAGGDGTIYKITPSGTLTTIYSFSASGQTDGAVPFAGLVLGQDGNFYGTTIGGGAGQEGTVFKVTPSGTLTTLHSFDYNTEGQGPESALVQGTDGNFYGTTTGGAANNAGIVFNITPSGILTPLHVFSSAGIEDGDGPCGPMIQGTDGNFYGTAQGGGQNDGGTVFQLTPSGTVTTLFSFSSFPNTVITNAYGSQPGGALLETTDGSLYGATTFGGAQGGGTLFKLSVPGLTSSPPTRVRFDFNKDGHADLFWYKPTTGQVATWDMNDQTVLAFNQAFNVVDPATGWQPVATPDVNNDGYPDIVWWNSQTGEMSIWTMQNTAVLSYGADFGTLADTDWKPVAAADVTGTTWELIFQNTATGAISEWQMKGESVVGYGGTLASLGPGSDWQVVGAPDIDGDGHSDLLFRNSSTGEISYWSTNLAAQEVIAYHGDIAQVTDPTWVLEGSEDVNGDGHPDFVWWNSTTGAVADWLLDGPTVTSYGAPFADEPDTNWQPTAIR